MRLKNKLVRFAHNLSRASMSCDWNDGILEYWNDGFWENGMVDIENLYEYNCIDFKEKQNGKKRKAALQVEGR